MRILLPILSLILLSSCWPTSISFVDGNMPEEWKTFSVKTLENMAPNTPLSYATELSEALKDGVMNNTRLLLNPNNDGAEVAIEGVIRSYSVSPIAMQEGDDAAQNRLTISVSFDIFISKPEEDEMAVTSTRYIDYDSNTDLATVETTLLEELNEQIVQDVINKLRSNW